MGCRPAKDVPKEEKRVQELPKVKTLLRRKDYILSYLLEIGNNDALFLARCPNESEFMMTIHVFLLKNEQVSEAIKKFTWLESYAKSIPYIVPYDTPEIISTQLYAFMQTKNTKVTLIDSIMENEFILSEHSLRNAIKGLLYSLFFAHKHNILHGRITPDKILFYKGDCYLYDFSVGGEISADIVASEEPVFVAPEIYRGEKPSLATDVWELGASIYYLISGSSLTKLGLGQRTGFKTVEPTFLRKSWKQVSSALKHLLSGMLKESPKARFAMEQVVNHPWLTADDKTLHKSTIQLPEKVVAAAKNKKIVLGGVQTIAANVDLSDIMPFRDVISDSDIKKTGTIGLQQMLSLMLTDPSPQATPGGINNTSLVNYSEVLARAASLKHLLLHERLAILFSEIAKGETKIWQEKLKELLKRLSFAEYTTSDEKLTNLIKNSQVSDSNDMGLTEKEFIEMLIALRYSPPEDVGEYCTLID